MLSGSSLSRNAWAIPIVRRSHTAHPGSPSKATFAMRLYGDRIDECTANRLDKSPLRKQMISLLMHRTERYMAGAFSRPST